MRGRTSQKAPGKAHGGQGQLRIIGGEWRSRRFAFPDGPGLRPTRTGCARPCSTGWHPMSRAPTCSTPSPAAAPCCSSAVAWRRQRPGLRSQPASVNALRGHLATLQCSAGEIQLGDALQLLARPAPRCFDIVLLDPPFHKDLLQAACTLLEAQGWLAADAWVYTESETPPSTLGLPGNWRLHREKHTGQVHYALWQRSAE